MRTKGYVGCHTSSINNMLQSFNNGSVVQKEYSQVGVPGWFKYFTFMGNYGSLLPAVALFYLESSLYLFLGQRS